MSRYSPQKEFIMTILNNTTEHPSAAAIYEQARQAIPNISLGTVYRNLERLSKDGEIQSFSFGDVCRFDCNPSPHPHFCCSSCGRVSDLECDFSQIEKLTQGLKGCEIKEEILLFCGLCSDCVGNSK